MNDAQVFGFEGTLLPSVHLYSRRVDVVIRLDRSEIDRRREAGIEALPDRDLMEALASLPHGTAGTRRCRPPQTQGQQGGCSKKVGTICFV